MKTLLNQKSKTLYRIPRALLSGLTVLVILSTPSYSWAAGTVRLYTSPSSASVTAGTYVSVQIRLSKDSMSRVDYVDAIVSYPAQLLDVTGISKSGSHFAAGGGPTTSFSNAAGIVQVNGSGETLPTQANVLVATVSFRAKAAGTASIAFSDKSQAGNLVGGGNVKNYLTSTSPTNLAITQPVAATKPKVTSTPTATPATTADTPAAENPEAAVVQDPPETYPIITEPNTASTLPELPATGSSSLLLTSGVLSGIAFLLVAAGLTLMYLRRRYHWHIHQSAGSLPEELTPKAAQTSDDPTENSEAAALLATKSAEKPDTQVDIHSIETTQSHPVQPHARLKPSGRKQPSSAPKKLAGGFVAAINTVHARPHPEVEPEPTVSTEADVEPSSKSAMPEPVVVSPKTPTPPEQTKQSETKESPRVPEPPHDPRVIVPTAEELAALPDDMFEAGAKRLELEGLDKPHPDNSGKQ